MVLYVVLYVVFYSLGIRSVGQESDPIILPMWFASVTSILAQLSLTFGALLVVASWVMEYIADKVDSIRNSSDRTDDRSGSRAS